MKYRTVYHPHRLIWVFVCAFIGTSLFEDQILGIIYGGIMAGVAGTLFPFKTFEKIKDEPTKESE